MALGLSQMTVQPWAWPVLSELLGPEQMEPLE
jgi:hypothetical protein